jgi:hypothetical protein
MTKRKINILDKIGAIIPGYNGYANREEKRNDDKKLRVEISRIINQSEILIEKYQHQLIKKGDISLCQEWEVARKSLNTLFTKVKNTSYGESSFFSENQIKDIELDEIYRLDCEMVEGVHLILKTAENDITEVMSKDIILNELKEIENILNQRTTFINRFK